MPTSALVYPTSSAGWTNSNNANAADGANATAQTSRAYVVADDAYDEEPTPQLVCGTFTGLNAGVNAGDTIVGIEVGIGVTKDGPGVNGSLSLAVNGTPVGGSRAVAFAGGEDFGGPADNWGAALQGIDLANLQICFFALKNAGDGTVNVALDYVNVRVTWSSSTPDAFTFTDITNATQSTLYISNTISVSGLSGGVHVPFSISGGEYQKNGGGWSTAPGTAINGDSFSVRVTSSSSPGVAVNSTLTIGGVSDTYTVTTANSDTTPDAFGWAPVGGVEPNSVIQSGDQVTITGINAAAAVTVVSGQYSVDGGGFTSGAGSANLGSVLLARGTASASFSTTVTVQVTVGGVTGNFAITTRAADTTPDTFTWTDAGTVAQGIVVTSNIITVAGIEAAANVTFSLSGGTTGEYKKAGGAWTAIGATTITNGQTLQVRFTSPAGANTSGDLLVTIGGVSDTFSCYTGVIVPPTQFTFTDVTGAVPGKLYTSNQITLAGGMTAATAQLTGVGAQMQINAGAWVTGSAAVVNGDKITVRQTASLIPGKKLDSTITIGAISDTYSVTTGVPQPQDF